MSLTRKKVAMAIAGALLPATIVCDVPDVDLLDGGSSVIFVPLPFFIPPFDFEFERDDDEFEFDFDFDD